MPLNFLYAADIAATRAAAPHFFDLLTDFIQISVFNTNIWIIHIFAYLTKAMKSLGNILWLILGGLLVAVIYILVGLLMCITIIGISARGHERQYGYLSST